MVRISDILKKMRQYQAGPEEQKAKPSEPEKEKLKPEGVEKAEEKKEIPSKDRVTFVEAMKKGKGAEKPTEAHIHEIVKKAIPEKGEGQNIYNDTIEYCKIIASGYAELKQEIDKGVLENVVAKVADYILFRGQELLSLVHEPYPDKENYRIYDLVNTAILTGHLGLSLGYNKSKLIEVMTVGLLHDLGMCDKELNFINEPRKLTAEEWNEVRKHPEKGAAYLEALAVCAEEVIKGVLHHHERIGGEGYPQGISDDDIDEYAQIVALVDAYEAMIHFRPHKNKVITANEAIKEIISLKDVLFKQRIIKALVEVIGIYPVGSWVEINTGEICRVLATNENLPLRPLLSVVFNKDKKRLKEIQTIDLKSNPSLYIKRPVEESELK